MAIISVIVPVYKAEKFIRHTVRSVQEQTFVDWELILIIDGSPDNSAQICRELAANDNRIEVIEQENLGAHGARLNGLHHCTAPFVSFLDSDDLLPPYSLDIMYSEMKKGYDIVKGTVAINVAPIRKRCDEYHAVSLDQQQFIEQIYLGDLDPYMCGSMYPRKLLDDYIYNLCIDNRLSIGEDWVTNLYVGRKIKKACLINECTYIYTENLTGIMNTSTMSQSYCKRMSETVDSFMDYNTPRWQYLKELKSALCVSDLFVWERGYSHFTYKRISAFSLKYGSEELKRRCDSRHLRFMGFEPLFYIYSRLYSFTKKLLKGKVRRIIID